MLLVGDEYFQVKDFDECCSIGLFVMANMIALRYTAIKHLKCS